MGLITPEIPAVVGVIVIIIAKGVPIAAIIGSTHAIAFTRVFTAAAVISLVISSAARA